MTRQDKPKVSERLAKLCSWAVVTLLEAHPRKEGMPPTLVYQTVEDGKAYQMKVGTRAYESMAQIFEEARAEFARLAPTRTVEAYALVVDAVEDVADIPTLRALDDNGNPCPLEQPTIFVYLGERESSEGVMVVQSYRGRLLRGGASPQGAPNILRGPDSILFGC